MIGSLGIWGMYKSLKAVTKSFFNVWNYFLKEITMQTINAGYSASEGLVPSIKIE
jgi:hypothetical protein